MDDGIFGAILFKRNVGTARETAALCRDIKTRAGRPFILSVDQEGGRVARLRGEPFTALPSMRELGQRGDEGLAERVGRLLAHELRAVGFDWDFAPVLDVDTNPANPVIGDRSFSRDADEVARLGVALGRGLEAGGVASCGKHFPGHGDTTTDSHLTLPRLPHDLERLRRVELVPFRAFAQAGLASLMTAHVLFDALEPGVPATMSHKRAPRRAARGAGLRRRARERRPGDEGHRGPLLGGGGRGAGHARRCGSVPRVPPGRACSGEPSRRWCRRWSPAACRARASTRPTAGSRGSRRASPIGPEDRLATLGDAEHRALAEGLASTFAGKDPTEVLT